MLGSEAFKESTTELVTRKASAFCTSCGRAFDVLHARLQVRAVATPVRDLSRLLAGTMETLEHLWAVERALRKRDGLNSVPPAVLIAASEQLAELSATTRSPGLGMLLLQMRRQVASDIARSELIRTGKAMNWRPTFDARHRSPSAYDPRAVRDSEFENTVPVDREDDDAGSNLAFIAAPRHPPASQKAA